MVNTRQPSERPVVNHADCFSHCEVVGLQVILTVFSRVIQGRPDGLFQSSSGDTIKILASMLFSDCVMCQNKMDRMLGLSEWEVVDDVPEGWNKF